MKHNAIGRYALGLSILFHAVLMTGIAWLSPFPTYSSAAASLELELITTQGLPSLPAPSPQELQSRPDSVAPIGSSIPKPHAVSATAENLLAVSAAVNANEYAVPAQANPSANSGNQTIAQAQTRVSYPPQLLNKVEPSYPDEARRLKLEGRIIIRLEVLQSGLAGAVTVQQSSGQQLLDDAALEAVKRWRFIPARDADGRAVLSVTTVPIVFKIR